MAMSKLLNLGRERCARWALASVLMVGLACVRAPQARAEGPATAASESPGDRAAKLYQLANEAFEKKMWAEAESAYLKAWSIMKTFDVAANLGEVEVHLDKPWDAATYLAYSLRMAPPSAKAAQRERTKFFLNEARAKVGTLRLRLDVPGGLVSVDGKAIAAEELANELFLKPGKHLIEAKREGYKDAQSTIDAKAGGVQEVALTLEPLPAERRSIVPLVALGAASVIGLGMGVATTIISNGKSADAETQGAQILKDGGQCAKPSSSFVGPCGTLKDTLKGLDTTANIARGAYVAAGALAIGTVIYALLPQPKPTASGRQVQALPTMGANGGGFVVVGTW
jgi:hypothetical protein